MDNKHVKVVFVPRLLLSLLSTPLHFSELLFRHRMVLVLFPCLPLSLQVSVRSLERLCSGCSSRRFAPFRSFSSSETKMLGCWPQAPSFVGASLGRHSSWRRALRRREVLPQMRSADGLNRYAGWFSNAQATTQGSVRGGGTTASKGDSVHGQRVYKGQVNSATAQKGRKQTVCKGGAINIDHQIQNFPTTIRDPISIF